MRYLYSASFVFTCIQLLLKSRLKNYVTKFSIQNIQTSFLENFNFLPISLQQIYLEGISDTRI